MSGLVEIGVAMQTLAWQGGVAAASRRRLRLARLAPNTDW